MIATEQIDVFGTQAQLQVSIEQAQLLPQWSQRLQQMHQCWTRFEPESELSRLNESSSFHASALLLRAMRASLDAAERSGGVVTPTILPQLLEQGYVTSMADTTEQKLAHLPAANGPASGSKQYKEITIDGDIVSKPQQVQLDLGGIGKGLAADMLAEGVNAKQLLLNIGGDLYYRGPLRNVSVRNPIDQSERQFSLQEGAVATSGINKRLWQKDGRMRHHIIDPGSGRSIWTVAQVSAIAPTATEAERLAKHVFLQPERAAELLQWGGWVVELDGEWRGYGAVSG